MLRYLIVILLSSGILSSCTSSRKPVIENVSTTTMVTRVPSPKETVLIPVGYSTCYTVKNSIVNHMWISAHHVCLYENVVNKGHAVWVNGYWMCTRYDIGANFKCHFWIWKPAHWSTSSVLY